MKKSLLIIFILLVANFGMLAQKDVKAVRGVWLTNVDSNVLNSKENIQKAVDYCSELGINTIFVVTWNKAMTTYPSKIMKKFTGVEIDTQFTGRDPLKELIEVAHKKNIKVFAWFEFGFSSSFKMNGGKLVKLKPSWAAINEEGKLVSKNGFDWINGFNPDVQNFMLSLIMEVVKNYNVDGIQGDDRLPAMPSESGYDPYTVNLYKSQHHGQTPPRNFKDSAWVQWRADILNNFMAKIYKTVKSFNKNIIVSMAPNLYPWCKEEYLQDWPTWLKDGYVDLIIPQVYRYKLNKYVKSLDETLNDQIGKKYFNKFYPGILLKVGDYYPSKKLLTGMIEANRKRGIYGEVYFFYEGLKRFPNIIKDSYKQKAEFPSLLK